ncbi:MAG: hypothetical protein AAF224_02845 [Pseudomonadota bacterium]
MTLANSDIPQPTPGETQDQFCKRLEANGLDEMRLRKSAREHFSMNPAEMGAYFENFPEARLRHLASLQETYPQGYQSNDRLTRKVSLDLGIPLEKASSWVKKIREYEADKK